MKSGAISTICRMGPVWLVTASMCLYTLTNFRSAFVVNPNNSQGSVSQARANHRFASTLNDEANVKVPSDSDGTNPMSLEERVRYLELKTNAFMTFGTNPFFGVQVKAEICKTMSSLDEFGCKVGRDGIDDNVMKNRCPGLFDHWICLDGLPEGPEPEQTSRNDDEPRVAPCLVYDFGVRAQPQLGATMARDFGCEVHAFDPSPVSVEWWESDASKSLKEMPNYHFHPYGAGGTDGTVVLKEYNWGQVSILRYPSFEFHCETNATICALTHRPSQSFHLPVKTLPTIMKELGHEGRTVDLLKVDVEGSEYAFLENLLDSSGGCPNFINQITLEWHHFPWDWRYGEGSSPPINVIATLFHTCGLKNIYQHSENGWPANEKIYRDLGMDDVRYNLATFYRNKSATE